MYFRIIQDLHKYFVFDVFFFEIVVFESHFQRNEMEFRICDADVAYFLRGGSSVDYMPCPIATLNVTSAHSAPREGKLYRAVLSIENCTKVRDG